MQQLWLGYGFILENLNDAECILCGKENVTLCRYCFSEFLIRILRELNFTEEMIENFKYTPLYDEIEDLEYNHIYGKIYIQNEEAFENQTMLNNIMEVK